MRDEPLAHRRHQWATLTCAVGSAPFLFAGRGEILWWGIPLWVYWSFAMTVALSILTGFGILRYWRDDDEA